MICNLGVFGANPTRGSIRDRRTKIERLLSIIDIYLPLLLKRDGNGKLSNRDGDRLGFPVFPLEWHDPKSGEILSLIHIYERRLLLHDLLVRKPLVYFLFLASRYKKTGVS